MIQIESAKAPFTSPHIAFQAVTALGRADAMGLLPADEHIETLDLPSFRKAVRHIHRAGIARNIQLDQGRSRRFGTESGADSRAPESRARGVARAGVRMESLNGSSRP